MADVVLAARWLLVAVFGVSSLVKLLDPRGFRDAVERYELLPPRLIPGVARTLPVLEIVAAASLAVGVLPRAGAAFACALLVVFVSAIAVNLVRGRRFDCGCGTADADISWRLVCVDCTFIAVALLVLLGHASPMTVWSGSGSGAVGESFAQALPVPLAVILMCLVIRGLFDARSGWLAWIAALRNH